MQRLVSILILLCFAPWSSASQPERLDPIEWVLSHWGDAILNVQGRDALRLTMTVETHSSLNAREVQREIAELARTPEHPRLFEMAIHAAMLTKPPMSSVTAVWFDRNHVRVDTSDSSPVLTRNWITEGISQWRKGRLSETAHGNLLWTRSASGESDQLTVIASGVPFPAVYNMSQSMGRQRELLIVALGGVHWHSRPTKVLDAKSGSDSWVILFELSESEQVRVAGSWDRDGVPLVRFSEYAHSLSPGLSSSVTYERHGFQAAVRRSVPELVVMRTRRNFVDTLHIDEMEAISRDVARSSLKLPGDMPAHATVFDFTSENSNAWKMHSDQPRITWTLNEEGDNIDFKEAIAAWRATPAGSRAASHSESSQGAWIMRVVVAVILATAFVLVIVRYKKAKTYARS